ncbi:hypothetical protein HZC31_03315 [Candidatus Woesearchaeota archaeon]|nr:hypothetical protein [Candidatus Woesearchaeota archaeon]
MVRVIDRNGSEAENMWAAVMEWTYALENEGRKMPPRPLTYSERKRHTEFAVELFSHRYSRDDRYITSLAESYSPDAHGHYTLGAFGISDFVRSLKQAALVKYPMPPNISSWGELKEQRTEQFRRYLYNERGVGASFENENFELAKLSPLEQRALDAVFGSFESNERIYTGICPGCCPFRVSVVKSMDSLDGVGINYGIGGFFPYLFEDPLQAYKDFNGPLSVYANGVEKVVLFG